MDQQPTDMQQFLADAFNRYHALIGTIDVPDKWCKLCAADKKEYGDMVMAIGETPVFDDNDCVVLMVAITGLSSDICHGFILGSHYGMGCEKSEPDEDN